MEKRNWCTNKIKGWEKKIADRVGLAAGHGGVPKEGGTVGQKRKEEEDDEEEEEEGGGEEERKREEGKREDEGVRNEGLPDDPSSSTV